MAKIINISDKFNLEKPSIQIGDKVYPVNNSLPVVMKFEEMVMGNKITSENLVTALKLTLGDSACKEIDVDNISIEQLKVLFTAITAAIQDIDYEVAEARFQDKG